jgi:uncharacterized protein YjeT (DUF2065 family)
MVKSILRNIWEMIKCLDVYVVTICILVLVGLMVFSSPATSQQMTDQMAKMGLENIHIEEESRWFACGRGYTGHNFTAENAKDLKVSGVVCTSMFGSIQVGVE